MYKKAFSQYTCATPTKINSINSIRMKFMERGSLRHDVNNPNMTCTSNIDLAKAKAKLPLHSFDSCQLTSTWMYTIRLHVPTQARKCDISHWLPCGVDRQTGRSMFM